MTSPTFRAFVALELPQAVREALAALVETLRGGEGARTVRWVRPEGIHLTLQFLGDIPEGHVEAVGAALAAQTHRRSFHLEVGGLGAFPNMRMARVLWVGLEGDLNALVALQHGVAQGLEGLGYTPERRDFSPHLTLGRIPYGRFDAARLYTGIAWPPVQALSFKVTGLSLMESRLLPQGARYTQRLFLPFRSQ